MLFLVIFQLVASEEERGYKADYKQHCGNNGGGQRNSVFCPFTVNGKDVGVYKHRRDRAKGKTDNGKECCGLMLFEDSGEYS